MIISRAREQDLPDEDSERVRDLIEDDVEVVSRKSAHARARAVDSHSIPEEHEHAELLKLLAD